MKKISVRVVSFAISIILVLALFSGYGNLGNVSAAVSKKSVVGEIKLNGMFNLNIDSNNDYKFVTFTPTEDGYYEFYTNQNDDVDLRMYCVSESEDNTYGTTNVSINRYSYYVNGFYNLKIVATLRKGTTYLVGGTFSQRRDQGGTISLYCISKFTDIRNYEFNSGDESQYNKFDYSGAPIDISKATLRCRKFNAKDSEDRYVLKYGVDWTVTGYCSSLAYQEGMENSIVWKSGFPKEKGNYILRAQGIGSYRGTKYIGISVMADLEVGSFTWEDLKKSGEQKRVERIKAKCIAIRPSTTANYVIESNTQYKYNPDGNNSGIGVYGTLYDKIGHKIGTYYDHYGIDVNAEKKHWNYDTSSEEYKNQEKYYNDHIFQFRITATLTGGEVYYLVVTSDSSYSVYDTKTQKVQYFYPDYVDVAINIPGYVYKAPTQPTTASAPAKTETNKPLAKGKTFVSGNVQYKVTTSSKGKYQVAVVKNKNKKAKKITIGASVKYKGTTYKITSIGSKAFAGSKNLTTVSIGKNVTSIGAGAFNGCSKLSKVTVTSTGLKKIGSNAFKGISKKAVIVVPKKQLKKYTKLFKGCKVASTVKIKAK